MQGKEDRREPIQATSPFPPPGWQRQGEAGSILHRSEDKLLREVCCPLLKKEMRTFEKNIIVGQEV
jgi:hypothetical protein